MNNLAYNDNYNTDSYSTESEKLLILICLQTIKV